MLWPFFDLRISSGEVLLRGVTDADLVVLAGVLPSDLEMDPGNERFGALEPEADRMRQLAAEVWKHRGTWSPNSWCLDLAVEVDGRVVGVQALEGERFPELRTVDSFSWLASDVRGRGLAHLMRAGVLALAFEHLGAEVAVSSARTDNVASLAVSYRQGYTDNGLSRTVTPTGPFELQHVRLSREAWRATGRGAEVTGVDACRPWFGAGTPLS
ncbi:MAG TPA: GNAT family protein [Nocardioides sp.]|jgi:RimJ/RimL family protein N-acetyltransferase|uniref:GNAT family N-acetyltransferase n=1 Tax=Nocardioides sp. TaxID=35761 RepID=UPI002E357DE3|nr:GNAT family protein [Nocardioides sp.]HEX3932715.1 GNAT family protein [Nocardioides sp.]